MADRKTEVIRKLSEESARLTAAYLDDPNDAVARIRARTAARNIHVALQEKQDAYVFLAEQATAASAIRFLLDLRAFEEIPSKGSIPAVQLASRLNCETELIARLMRLAVAAGFFEEPEADAYVHNSGSEAFLDPAIRAIHMILQDDFVNGSWPALSKYYGNGNKVKKCPDELDHHPYGIAFDMNGQDWHEVAARSPENLQKYSDFFNGECFSAPIQGIYPFENLAQASIDAEKEDGVLMVDIGGRHGFTLKQIRDSFPQLKARMIVQDQPPVIDTIPPNFLPPEIVPMIHDFWTPQPVKNAKAYYFRRTLHDWTNEKCIEILRHIADAMNEKSIILVTDSVIPERVQRDDTWVYTMDLTMMLFSGKERTQKDWDFVFAESGLELVKVWLAPGSYMGVVEGRKRRY